MSDEVFLGGDCSGGVSDKVFLGGGGLEEGSDFLCGNCVGEVLTFLFVSGSERVCDEVFDEECGSG